MSSRSGYSLLQIGLHWLITVLVVAVWFLGEGMEDALDARLESGATGIAGNTLHVWLGGLVFALILIRLVVRFTRGAPGPVSAEPAWAAAAATWGHRLLYLLMVAVPALGATTWYLGIEDLGDLHGLVANALLIVAGLHGLVALWHQFIARDGTLMRMLRPGA